MKTPLTPSQLFERYLKDECSEEEIKLLLLYFKANNDEDLLKERIRAQLEDSSSPGQIPVKKSVIDASFQNLQAYIHSAKRRTPLSVFSNSWIRVAAAAIVLVMISVGGFLWFGPHTPKPQNMALLSQSVRFKNDVLPGKDQALLILADGRKIVLDNTQNGAVAVQGNTAITKNNNKLVYDASSAMKSVMMPVLYNTVATPRGGQYQVTLPDGTKVWLNASSSLKFPTLFAGRERRVEITGEAYFEVAKMNTTPSLSGGEKVAMPFIVSVNGMEVKVLGTHFNINAYSDEAVIKTTLLEGSVLVSELKTHNSRMITPGQQAQLDARGEFNVTYSNNEEVMAWKNGIFQFDDTDITAVMRQISRWYNVDVVYAGKVPVQRFGGALSRKSNLSQVFKILEISGVRFTIDGDKVTVLP